MSQLILDEYLPNKNNGIDEIKYMEVAQFVGRNFPHMHGGFDKGGAIEITCRYLHEKGIKVWR